MAYGARLESVLGESPRGFESPILRFDTEPDSLTSGRQRVAKRSKLHKALRRAFLNSNPEPAELKIKRVAPEASDQELRQILVAQKTSMTGIERLWALLQAVKYAESHNIAGDFVECGVWKGGSSRLMAQVLADSQSFSRQIWLYDTFEGMVPPTGDDIRSNGKTAQQMLTEQMSNLEDSLIWAIAPEEEVRENLLESGYPEEKLVFVRGDVVETLKQQTPDRIAILRLDTDWYQSTKVELEILMPKMSPGSVVIIDDYGDWEGARKAVDQFLDELEPRPLVHRIDHTGRMWIV